MMVDDVKQNLKEPGAAIGSRLKAVKRFPRFQISLLYEIFGLSSISNHPHRSSVEVVKVGHGHRLKLFDRNPVSESHCCTSLGSQKRVYGIPPTPLVIFELLPDDSRTSWSP